MRAQQCHGLRPPNVLPAPHPHRRFVDSRLRPEFPRSRIDAAGSVARYNDWGFNAWGGKYETLMADDASVRLLEPLLGIPRFTPGSCSKAARSTSTAPASC